MNERILELAEQTSLELFNDTAHHRLLKGFAKRFAELIVKECARIAFDESAHAGRMNKPGNCLFGTNIGRRIETHFGVKE